MTTKVADNSILKFGQILFTPIWVTAVDHCASGLLKVRLSFKGWNVPPPPPKPLPNTDIQGVTGGMCETSGECSLC